MKDAPKTAAELLALPVIEPFRVEEKTLESGTKVKVLRMTEQLLSFWIPEDCVQLARDADGVAWAFCRTVNGVYRRRCL